jgi:ectoine hydroxylase-related dioxygenase (phytanoyl-CoA dioxygenase family)
MPELRAIGSTQVDEILAAVEEDGACIALNVLTAPQCENLIGDFDRHLEEMPWGEDELGYRDEFYGERTKRLHGLFSKSSGMQDVLTHPLFLELGRRMFIDTGMSKDIRLSNTELMVLNKGQSVQVFHTDAASWHRVQQAEESEILISANCAVTRFTETNGATRVVPGSHRWQPGREPQDNEITQAVMPQGAALIYAGNVLHSGGANVDAETRVGLYLGYIVSWLRPLENQLITNEPGDILALSERAQRLLDVSPGGFTVFA